MTGRAWTDYRPGHFDRARLGKREPAPGLFGRSEALQLPGQGDLFGEPETRADEDAAGSDCLEFQ